jgi:integrase
MDWDKMTALVQKLEKDGNYKFALLIAVGCYTGLRISDILNLKWENVLYQNILVLTEKKTKKNRSIHLNPELVKIINRLYSKLGILDDGEFMFINRFGTKPINVQYVNRRLKEIFKHYKIRIPNVSTHTFRKTLGRRVWENNDGSERSLILLGELFNHSSVKTTKIYLGIREEEIGDVYLGL